MKRVHASREQLLKFPSVSLRNLVKTVPDLTLVDLTFGYPGACNAPTSYPEDHYSLSIWFKQVPPPAVHVHVRQWRVLTEVPLGKLDNVAESEGTVEERQAFDHWLRERWAEKDQLMERFATGGSFVASLSKPALESAKHVPGEPQKVVEWPVRLRHSWEFVEAFSWFSPVIVGVAIAWFCSSLLNIGPAEHCFATARAAKQSLDVAAAAVRHTNEL